VRPRFPCLDQRVRTNSPGATRAFLFGPLAIYTCGVYLTAVALWPNKNTADDGEFGNV